MHAAKFWRGLDFALEGTGAEPLRALAREVRKRKNWEEPNILPVRASARHRSAPRCRVGQLHEVVLSVTEEKDRAMRSGRFRRHPPARCHRSRPLSRLRTAFSLLTRIANSSPLESLGRRASSERSRRSI